MKCTVDIQIHGHVLIPVEVEDVEEAENKAWDMLADMDSSAIVDCLEADLYSVTCGDECNYRR